MKKGTYLKQVREQYENYPYPERKPEDEKGVLLSAKSTSLDCLNFFCFEGNRDFSKPFRVLIPGGGTGDCTIYLAEQLRDTPAEIVYLDMSQSSMKVAKERAKVRKLNNITWVHDSLLNLPSSGLGQFDFITCTGVLHHLADPVAGLKALKSVLHPDGSMYIMLYAQYGRTSIYQMQDLLRRVHANEPDMQKRIDRTRQILKTLPEGNWFNFCSQAYGLELKSDIGLYDLLLHPQDRAYTVPELFDFVESEGLVVNKLFNSDHPLGDMLFQPETFIKDPDILKGVKKQSFKEQAAICELLFGQLMKQACFISLKEKNIPAIDNMDLVPSIAVSFSSLDKYESLKNTFIANSQKITLNPFVSFNRSPFAADIFNSIDGVRSSRKIVDLISQKFNSVDRDVIENHYKSIIEILNKVSMLYLRKEGLASYPSLAEMQQRMISYYGEAQCGRAKENYIRDIQAGYQNI